MLTNSHLWQQWSIKDWNKALLNHFFRDTDGEDRPIHRIPVTGDELRKIVGEPDADTNEVQEAFLSALRTPSHILFNRRLAQYPLDLQVGWGGGSIPPFVADLAFTCLVASPPDGEIRSVGDFRRRLALLMNHSRAKANYPLKTLPTLWIALSRWLDMKRDAGGSYRRLDLPPPGSKVLIGYSINLAFPSRKDLDHLIRVLSTGDLPSVPTFPAVFRLLENKIKAFSYSFRKSYEEFREAYRTRKTDLDQYPFWGAIREALDSDEFIQTGAAEEGADHLLVLEAGGAVLLLSDTPRELVKDDISFVEVDTPYGEFRSVLCSMENPEKGFRDATLWLLRRRFRNQLTGKGWPMIRFALQQGVLLFAKTERLSWELVSTFREDEDYQALVINSLVHHLLSAFPTNQRPDSSESQYQGWTLLERFSGACLKSVHYDDQSPLAEIRCLQPTVSRPQLSLVGGCPVDGGYLGIPEYLPSVRAPGSTKVALLSLESKQSKVFCYLASVAPASNEFVFPSDFNTRLKGQFLFVGSRGDRVIVRKGVVFRPDIIVNEYAQPTRPMAWLVEAGGPDTITYEEHYNKEKSQCGQVSTEKAEVHDEGGLTAGSLPQFSSKTIPDDWRRYHSTILPSYSTANSFFNDFKAARKLMEICGGLAMRRRGLPEVEFLELIQKTLTVERYHVWDVVRAWIEAGYLDQLMYKKWRRTEYYARRPQLKLSHNGQLVRGALTGLTTSVLLNRVDLELQAKGAKKLETFSFSKWLPPIPMWEAQDARPFEEACRILALGEPSWIQVITNTLWLLNVVVSDKRDPPRFFDCWGCWDWKRGGFNKDVKPSDQGIEVVRLLHTQRPAVYQILVAGEHFWSSVARNWALLKAYDLHSTPCFALAGTNQISRSIKGQVYLPLPIARHLAATHLTTPGPIEGSSGDYAYNFKDSAERTCLLTAIWGGSAVSNEELRRWGRWMLTIAKRKASGLGGHAISLPPSIKKNLEQFKDIPELRELSHATVHGSLLPRLRDGLSRFLKAREN